VGEHGAKKNSQAAPDTAIIRLGLRISVPGFVRVCFATLRCDRTIGNARHDPQKTCDGPARRLQALVIRFIPRLSSELTAQYCYRSQPQGSEEIAQILIDTAVSSDWLLHRLRQTESQIWDRPRKSVPRIFASGGRRPRPILRAAFRDQQKGFERLQRRISAVERSFRASLEALARLR
jgi:hypothetical protein